MTLTLTLPMPPTVNHLHTVARGRKIKSQRARDYSTDVAWRIAEHYRTHPNAWRPPGGTRLRVKARIYPENRRRADIDNYSKALLDSIFACWEDADDSQVDVLTLVREAPSDDPRAVVTIEAIA